MTSTVPVLYCYNSFVNDALGSFGAGNASDLRMAAYNGAGVSVNVSMAIGTGVSSPSFQGKVTVQSNYLC